MNSYKLSHFYQTRRRGIWIGSIFLILFLLLSWGAVLAIPVDEELENKVRAISHQLRCPTCQAMSVKESDAGLSLNMKNKVRDMLQEGKSEEDILKFFVVRYGEWILRSPKKEGFNLVLWLTPLVLIVVVGLIVVRVLWKRSGKIRKVQLAPLSAREKALLEKDLDHFQAE